MIDIEAIRARWADVSPWPWQHEAIAHAPEDVAALIAEVEYQSTLARQVAAELTQVRAELSAWREGGRRALAMVLPEVEFVTRAHDLRQGCVGCPCGDAGGPDDHDPWCNAGGFEPQDHRAFWGKPAPATCPLRKGPIVICAAADKEEGCDD